MNITLVFLVQMKRILDLFETNFIKLKKLEQKIGKNKKISLDDEINNIGDKQKENFINWIENQRNYFKTQLNGY